MKKLVKFLINTVPRPYLIWWSNFFSPILDIYYRGTKFIVPINGKSYRKFLPYGYVKQRENAQYEKGGVFYDLKKWLLNNSEDYGFYLTYNNNSFVKPDGR